MTRLLAGAVQLLGMYEIHQVLGDDAWEALVGSALLCLPITFLRFPYINYLRFADREVGMPRPRPWGGE